LSLSSCSFVKTSPRLCGSMLDRQGILEEALLDLVPGVHQPAQTTSTAPSLQANILDLLRRYGLAYPSNPGTFYYVPTRCKEDPPQNLFQEMFPLAAMPLGAQLCGLRIGFPGSEPGTFSRLPDGFAESVIVGLHSFLNTSLQQRPSSRGLPGVVHQWMHGSLFGGVVSPQFCLPVGGDGSAQWDLLILIQVPLHDSTHLGNVLELLWMLKPQAPEGATKPSQALLLQTWHLFRRFYDDNISSAARRFSPFVQPVVQILEQVTTSTSTDSHQAPNFQWQVGVESVFWKDVLPKHRPEVRCL
jgi:hypothetical protein